MNIIRSISSGSNSSDGGSGGGGNFLNNSQSMSLDDIDIIENDIDFMDDDVLKDKILWSCIARDDTILCEACADNTIRSMDDIGQTAKELLARKPTPGFEFHKQTGVSITNMKNMMNKNNTTKRKTPLRGIKFHVYEHVNKNQNKNNNNTSKQDDFVYDGSDGDDNDFTRNPELRVWVFAAVYDPDLLNNRIVGRNSRRNNDIGKKDVQRFLEKMVTLTENLREYDTTWNTCTTLGLQSTFAPVLKQRMEDVTYYGKMSLLEEQINTCQNTMEKNIQLLMERGDKIDNLHEKATRMEEMTKIFKKRAKQVKKQQMMKNAKYGIVLGTTVTAVTAAIVIPPLIALL